MKIPRITTIKYMEGTRENTRSNVKQIEQIHMHNHIILCLSPVSHLTHIMTSNYIPLSNTKIHRDSNLTVRKLW